MRGAVVVADKITERCKDHGGHQHNTVAGEISLKTAQQRHSKHGLGSVSMLNDCLTRQRVFVLGVCHCSEGLVRYNFNAVYHCENHITLLALSLQSKV